MGGLQVGSKWGQMKGKWSASGANGGASGGKGGANVANGDEWESKRAAHWGLKEGANGEQLRQMGGGGE